MSDLHITWVDFFVALVVVASMGFAIYRGFVRETLSIFSWAAAAFATLYFGRYVVPLMAPHFSPLMAEIVAYSAVFVLVLLPLSFIGHRISQSVQGSPVGPIDRSLGAAFGVLRGLAVVAMVYILYSLVVPVHAQKAWITSARSLPLIQTSAKVLLSLLPSEQSSFVQERTGKPQTDTVETSPEPSTKPKTADLPPPKHVKHVVHAGGAIHHSKRTHVVKLAHATTETETPAPAAKAAPAPAQLGAPAAKKPVRKGYGADDRRALNRLIESTGNGGGQ
jgi:membrane protein required for colicin V production